jgi:hypothetical protein
LTCQLQCYIIIIIVHIRVSRDSVCKNIYFAAGNNLKYVQNYDIL